ncbi:MAG TPA: YfiR family protein [Terriglobales bacterium]
MCPSRFHLARLCWTVAAIILVLAASYSSAQERRPTENQVEAAYLYNFGKFVTWPAERAMPTSQFEICVLGKDPFGEVLDATVTGENINGKKIAVRRLSSMQQVESCRILFVSSSEEERLSTILEAAQRLSLLTVSTMKHFARRGGDIGLVSQNDRIRFEVNRAAVAKSHLLLSSELLKVAVKVIGEPGS